MTGAKTSYLRRYLYSILAVVTYLFVHESIHIIQAVIYGVYKGVKILPLGIEIEIIQPLTIDGVKLAAFSGLSGMVTILIGYTLFFVSPKVLRLNKQCIKNYIYYVTFYFLLLDPIYISILSFFVGGDINGIALGLNLPYTAIRGIYFIIAFINGLLVYRRLYPVYVLKVQ